MQKRSIKRDIIVYNYGDYSRRSSHIKQITEEMGMQTIESKGVYCRVPARQGLQRTARAATRHRARDPLVRPQVDQT